MRDMMFNGYIARTFTGSTLTDRELMVLKNGDIDAMVSTFVRLRQEEYVMQLKCVLKCIKGFFGDGVTFEAISTKEHCEGKFVGSQIMDGDMDVFFGIVGNDDILLKIASDFAQEEFTDFGEDAYDAICEFINNLNGSFATKLSDENIDVTLYPPVFYDDIYIESEKGFYVVTLGYAGDQFDLVMAINEKVNLITE